MHGQYRSRLTPFYASEDISFDLRLMQRAEVQKLSEYDIYVEIFTSQLSPRKTVMSVVSNPDNQKDIEGADIVRYSDHFVLNLHPTLLQVFPSGVLTLAIRYRSENSMITNVLITERFLNDTPANSDLVVD